MKNLILVLFLLVTFNLHAQFLCAPNFNSGQWSTVNQQLFKPWTIVSNQARVQNVPPGWFALLEVTVTLTEPRILKWNWRNDMHPDDRITCRTSQSSTALGALFGGNGAPTVTATSVPLAAGTHRFTWTVQKNSNESVGSNTAYLNWIQLIPVPPVLHIDSTHVFWTAHPSYILQSSTNLITWVTETNVEVGGGGFGGYDGGGAGVEIPSGPPFPGGGGGTSSASFVPGARKFYRLFRADPCN